MKILLTGAGGQLGRCLTVALGHHHLVPLDHRSLDITKLRDVRRATAYHRPELVINAAAYNAVDQAEAAMEEAYAINALGPRNLALAAAEVDATILHVSTDYVFSGSLRRPYHEFDDVHPLSVYGASKLAGEHVVQELNPRHYIVRTAWLFWEHGKNSFRQMATRVAISEVRVVDDQFGSPTYAPHLADAIAELIRSKAYGVYHLAGQGEASRWEVVDALFRELELPSPLPVPSSFFQTAATRPRYSVLTSIQDPKILLPPWRQGVAVFARRLRQS